MAGLHLLQVLEFVAAAVIHPHRQTHVGVQHFCKDLWRFAIKSAQCKINTHVWETCCESPLVVLQSKEPALRSRARTRAHTHALVNSYVIPSRFLPRWSQVGISSTSFKHIRFVCGSLTSEGHQNKNRTPVRVYFTSSWKTNKCQWIDAACGEQNLTLECRFPSEEKKNLRRGKEKQKCVTLGLTVVDYLQIVLIAPTSRTKM